MSRELTLQQPRRDLQVAGLPLFAAGPRTGAGSGWRRTMRSQTKVRVKPGPLLEGAEKRRKRGSRRRLARSLGCQALRFRASQRNSGPAAQEEPGGDLAFFARHSVKEAKGAARPEEYGCEVEGLPGVFRGLSVCGGSCFLKVAKKAGTVYASLRQTPAGAGRRREARKGLI